MLTSTSEGQQVLADDTATNQVSLQPASPATWQVTKQAEGGKRYPLPVF